jgi:hypothetical protein
MLIELLTPLVLATAPTAITVDDQIKYSHETQSVVAFNDNGPISFTANGTRTYSGNGTPMDADSD